MKKFSEISISQKTIPWFLLGAAVLSFGLLIPWLGFYQDDWHHIYYFSKGGAEGLRQFLFMDSRPFAFLVYEPLFNFLGVAPIGWHITLLFFRFLTALTFWLILNQIWTEAQAKNAIVALLFLIYPAFLLQPMSVMFALHWTMYFVFMLSVLIMLKAVQRPRYFVALMTISLVLEMAHLLMLEYFVGLELLRPLFLLMLLRKKEFRERIGQVLKISAPFLLVAGIYIPFRLSFNTIFDYDRNSPVILLRLLDAPLKTIGYLIQVMFQDFTEILITAWYNTIEPSLFYFSQRSNLLIWVGVVLFTGLFWVYFRKLEPSQHDVNQANDWAKGMLILGFLSLLAGVLPGWAVGKTVHETNPLWNDRFAMASMFGAAMSWVGAVFLLLRKRSHILLMLGFMVSVAIGANLRTAITYKQSWEKQEKFYWQLYWRAPALEEDTALVADSEFLYYMGVYPASFAINTLYQNNTPASDPDYWLYVAGEHLPPWDNFRAGEPLEFNKYASKFEGNTLDTLAMLFEPEKLQCLWILRPEDQINRSFPEVTYQYLSTSNLDRVQADSLYAPSEAIFGREPQDDRCYYYEKADLARQLEDWDAVTAIWTEAERLDLLPYSGVEYVPFIEAFAHTGDWESAKTLTLRANRITERMSPYLCEIWQGLDYQEAPLGTRQNLAERLSCDVLLDNEG